MDFTSDLSSDINGSQNHNSSSSSFLGVTTRRKGISPTVSNNGDNDTSSDIEGMNMLSAKDKKQLKLEELRESLQRQRESLLKEVDTLTSELENTVEPKFTPEPFPEENDEKIDDNMARTLVDLLTLSSRNNRFSGMDTDDYLPAKKRSKIDGNSGMQQELMSKYDTLPLLNMNLRLRYLKQFLYPHMRMSIREMSDRDHDKNDTTKEVMVSASFERNTHYPIRLKFKVHYDTNDETLKRFEVLELLPSMVHLNVKAQEAATSPTNFLFALNEYDRLLHKRQSLFDDVINQYKVWIDPEFINTSNAKYAESDRTMIIRNKRPNNVQLQITIRVGFLDDQAIVPRTTISLRLLCNGNEVQEPDINGLFYGLMKEYGLAMSLRQLIQTTLFP
ncbi:hypothetical protein C6P45_004911 [Maudiozyma exigua]|uniref:Central kinetochore subunit CTF19 n=1 Tax=Maudiozyma exigua TaxID=34358 RepID=A0A9P7BA21_MAUEX|nr:hypothetical protein C6P45_004911 [Kazachstania exigua]